MKSFVILLTLSLGANALLAGWVLKHASGLPVGKSAAATPVVISRHTEGPRPAPAEPAQVPLPPAQATPAGITSWSDLETSDLKELIRRLRALGCPEETIRDIIEAEVNRRFSSRQSAIWPDLFGADSYWKSQKRDDTATKLNRERSRQYRDLQREKSRLLVDLLGVDPEKERRKMEGLEQWQNFQDSQVSFLPEPRRDAVSKYLEDFQEKMQDFYTQSQGLWDAQTRAEQRALEAERLQGLSQFLSPEEVREFDLRQSQIANQITYDLHGFSLTREQYEALFDIRKKYGDSIYNYGDIEAQADRKQVEENQKAMKAELSAALGDQTAHELERVQDYSYQQLTRLAARNDLSSDVAGKVFDFKDAAEQSINKLRNDASLTQEQRDQALQQIRSETVEAVKSALGDKAYEKYLQNGGWWINNLAPPRKS